MTKKALHTQFNGINRLRDAIIKRQVSALEITKSAISKAKELAHLNVFLHIDEELSLEQAKAIDKIVSDDPKKLPVCCGIPIAHKDNIVTKYWRTTASSNMLKNYTSPFDATVVEHFKKHGSILIGKVNCDEFGMGSTNENSSFGPVKNPWDNNLVSGGSSGGSAAAVASRIVMASTGTDTGGSIRMPAALCGVCGIKPTYGTVSRYGVIAFSSSLDQVGVMATSSLDLIEVLNIISSHDSKDSTSLRICNGLENKTGRIKSTFNKTKMLLDRNNSLPLKGIRIGLPKEFFNTPIEESILVTIKKAIFEFEKLGASMVEISMPYTEISVPTYYAISSAEAASNLSRYDGVRYGYRSTKFNNIDEMISRSRAEGFGNQVKARILLGTYMLSQENYEQFYLKAQKIRRKIVDNFKEIFQKECDLIIGPVYTKNTKKIGVGNINATDWLDDMYTVSASLAGLPAMSIPCGFVQQNERLNPVGIQIIGNYFSEGLMIAISDYYQQVTNWHIQMPDNI